MKEDQELEELLSYGSRIPDEVVRAIFPRPSRMAVDLLNLQGRDVELDGGFQRALAHKGLRADYDGLNCLWVVQGR